MLEYDRIDLSEEIDVSKTNSFSQNKLKIYVRIK